MARFALVVSVTIAVLGLSGAAGAGSPARIAPADPSAAAGASFEAFARDFMERVRERSAQQREKPTLRPGSEAMVATYRDVDGHFETELRPTGSPRAPYIGVLRYTELVFSCTDIEATTCEVATTVPVTEIFRLRDGRWTY